MKKYPTIVLSNFFLNQEHIAELQQENLLIDYLHLMIALEKSSFVYIHSRKNFYEDLGKIGAISKESAEKIINIVVKHNVFHYKYNKMGYFNEKNLCYDNGKNKQREIVSLSNKERNQQERKCDNDIDEIGDEEWQDIIK